MIGKQLGDYRILEELGHGGMGVVYLAEQIHMGSRHAIKVLPEEFARNREFVTRFKTEAQLMFRLKHPNIVSVTDMGFDQGCYYLVMEYACGFLDKPETLTDLLAAHGDILPPSTVLQYARQICDALEYAHTQGVIHRDIKPGNILLDAKGNIKIADFGLAKITGTGASGETIDRTVAKTVTGAVLGTYDYMSPEQRQGREVDHRSDIYSLGMTLFELLTGRRPGGVMESNEDYGITVEWYEMLRRCLEQDPAARYQKIGDVQKRLKRLQARVRNKPSRKKPSRERSPVKVVLSVLFLPFRLFMLNFRAIFLNLLVAMLLLLLILSAVLYWRLGRERKEEEKVLTLPGGVTMEFVKIPAGSFMMGSPSSESGRDSDEGPRHRVKFNRDFWMGKYEVTLAQWQAVMESNPSDFKGDSNPVENVSWDDCQEFLKKLNSLVSEGEFRLPSEAEWEYACRAGSKTRYCFGDSVSQLDDYAWYVSNSGSQTYGQTHPVGQKRPNAWGLYDMQGNVYEWCEDWYHDSYNDAPSDGSAWVSPEGPGRVLRGGSWYHKSDLCRAAVRIGRGPDSRYFDYGFRVVEPSPAPESAQVRAKPSSRPSPSGSPEKSESWQVQGDEAVLALPGGVTMEFVNIPAGNFTMGSNHNDYDSEKPIHRVTFSRDFWMGKYEVTQAQWQAVMGSNPGNNLPMEPVSWNDCKEFLQKLNSRVPNANLRLPSEVEWEYACRAGSTTQYCFGDSDSDLGDYAWYSSNSGFQTHPVGQKRPNAWGLYDMHGNVYEWCEDWYHDSYNGAPEDGSAWVSPEGSGRVLRGGGWIMDPDFCRAAHRLRSGPDKRGYFRFGSGFGFGFRCARSS